MFWFWFHSFLFMYFCLVLFCFFFFFLFFLVCFGFVLFGVVWFALVASVVSNLRKLVEELCPLRFVPVRENRTGIPVFFYHIGIIPVFTNRYAALVFMYVKSLKVLHFSCK